MGKYQIFHQICPFPQDQNSHLRVQVGYVQYTAAGKWGTGEFQDTVKFKSDRICLALQQKCKVIVIGKCTGEGGERRKG